MLRTLPNAGLSWWEGNFNSHSLRPSFIKSLTEGGGVSNFREFAYGEV